MFNRKLKKVLKEYIKFLKLKLEIKELESVLPEREIKEFREDFKSDKKNTIQSTKKITRLEIINHSKKDAIITQGRNVISNFELSVQDDGMTLKIFLD